MAWFFRSLETEVDPTSPEPPRQ
ncbi:hypothetical protein FMEAI12_6820004 [Parafrankia sp. Ea1.12]|nr:hypothetical protein FMEAI12_6820004 [Parafrankia sp. Ea1.12]